MCALRVQLTACTICAPQHRTRNPCQVSHAHGLASSAIARHYTRNHNCFLLLRVLRCFTSPRQPPHRLCIHLRVTPHNWCWVSPFGHPRINALLATPRGITQPHTSFIGSACQGIHHTPVTKHTDTQTIKVQTPKHKKERYSRPLYSSHTTQPPHTTNHTQAASRHESPTGTTLCCPRHPTVHQRIIFCHANRMHPPTRHHAAHNPFTGQPHHHPDDATMTLKVCLHPAKILPWQSHTRRLNHTNNDPQLRAHK